MAIVVRTALGALLLVTAVGCATQENYQKIVESWMNYDVYKLMRSWGAPTSTFQMPNGNTLLVYESRGSFTTPTAITPERSSGYFVGSHYSSTTTPSTVIGGDPIPLTCRTEFEAEPSGKLVRWQFQGNTCRARAPQ